MMLDTLAQTAAPGAGFADIVLDGQSAFRTVMDALAEPGVVLPLDPGMLAALEAPTPLRPATAAILLALADFETSVWLDPALGTTEITAYLRFHTGASLVLDRAKAVFAVIADGAELAGLDGFAAGTLDYPDRSTTLIVQVSSLTEGPAWTLSGPGIADTRTLRLSPVHAALASALQANRALFPCGVDILFTDGASVVGLPRSTFVGVNPDRSGLDDLSGTDAVIKEA